MTMEQDVAPKEMKVSWEPDRDALRLLVDRPGGASETEFFQAMSPKTWEIPQADTVDQLMNSLGIVTPGVAAGRKRAEEYEQLAPLYKEFMQRKLGQAFSPSQAEAINRGFIPTPSVAPQTMMPGPRVTTPGNLEDVIGGYSSAASEPQTRPGLQPEGFPQNTGPFGLPQPYLPGTTLMTPLTPPYQFPTNEPGPMVPNMQAPLRPIDQGIVNARIEALKHPRAAVTIPAGLQEHERMVQAEINAQVVENGGKPLSARALADIELKVGKVYTPEAQKGTPTYRKTSAEAGIQETEQGRRDQLLDATIKEKTSRATLETQQTLDAAGLFQARLKHLESQAALDNANAGRLGQTVFNQQAMLELQRASKTLDGLKMLWAADKLDDAGFMAYIKSYMETTEKHLSLQGVSPNVIQDLLGITPTQMTVSPGRVGPPVTTIPTPTQVPGNKAEEELNALEKANPGYEYQRKPDGTLQRRKKS